MSNLSKNIATAARKEPAELVIKNGRIIDVFNLEIISADVAITNGTIVGIGDYDGKQVVDAQNRYICPGFIDGHVHIESAMLTPEEYAQVVLPHGVTTIIADPHEIANVSGLEGINFMLAAAETLPLNIYYMLPSCVPATPFENAGASLTAADLRPLYEHERVLGLGEVMDYPAVRNRHEPMLAKIIDASRRSAPIDGHGAGLDAKGINVYMSAGIRTDHEATTPKEAKERLQRGMYLMLREGSASKDLLNLLEAVNEKNARRCLFVTDDKHLDDLLELGSIDHQVRLTIQQGFNPLLAIQMATLNAAECFGLATKGAIAPGYDADFLLLDELKDVKLSEVYAAGKLVAKEGRCTIPLPKKEVPIKLLQSIKISAIQKKDLELQLNNSLANIIEIIPNSLLTKHIVEEVLLSAEGAFIPSIEHDQLKLAVIERHKQTGNIGLGIVKGLSFQSGAIASTVAHDSHNLVVAGTNDEDMLAAIEQINKLGGGLAAVNQGQLRASISLPIGGLMSTQSFEQVYTDVKKLNKALKDMGFNQHFNPFLTLSFLALPVIPELKLTDLGLFNVSIFKHISSSYSPGSNLTEN